MTGDNHASTKINCVLITTALYHENTISSSQNTSYNGFYNKIHEQIALYVLQFHVGSSRPNPCPHADASRRVNSIRQLSLVRKMYAERLYRQESGAMNWAMSPTTTEFARFTPTTVQPNQHCR